MSNFWTCLTGISTSISAVVMIFITIYLHKLTSRNNKKEKYFTHMVELYNRIEDDLRILTDVEKDTSHTFQHQQSVRRIKVNCTIMIYYLLRIPGIYEGRMEFMGILYSLSSKPYNELYYSKLSEKFVEFCWELRDKKATRNLRSFNYDGKPLEK